jgi:hypothetical protein
MLPLPYELRLYIYEIYKHELKTSYNLRILQIRGMDIVKYEIYMMKMDWSFHRKNIVRNRRPARYMQFPTN